MKKTNKFRIKFPEIKDITSTAYVENQINKIEVWQKKHKPTKSGVLQSLEYNFDKSYAGTTFSTILELQKKSHRQNDIQLNSKEIAIENIDQILQKIQKINYKKQCTDIEMCCQNYKQQFEKIQNLILSTKSELSIRIVSCKQQLIDMRKNHLQKMEKDLIYDRKSVAEKNLEILEKENEIKRYRRRLNKVNNTLKYFFEKSLKSGLYTKQTGLLWLIKRLDRRPVESELPDFLTEAEKSFLIQRYDNDKEKTSSIQEKQEIEKQLWKSTIQVSKSTSGINSPVFENSFRSIDQKNLKCNMLKSYVNRRIQQINFHKEKIKTIIKKYAQVRATSNELIYSEAKIKLRNIYSNMNLQLVNRQERKKKIRLQKRYLQSEKKLEKLIQKQHKMCRLQLSILKFQFSRQDSQSYLPTKTRIPFMILSALFGWEDAKKYLRESKQLQSYMQQFINST